MNLEQLGYLGIFLGGATPWFEALGMVPAGVIFGLDPVWTVIIAVAGNALTIFAFAYAGSGIKAWFVKRRQAKGKSGEPKRFARAAAAFEKYGLWVMAVLNPILIGSQFAAAASVAAGVKPLKVSLVYTASAAVWSILIAVAVVSLGLQIPV